MKAKGVEKLGTGARREKGHMWLKVENRLSRWKGVREWKEGKKWEREATEKGVFEKHYNEAYFFVS